MRLHTVLPLLHQERFQTELLSAVSGLKKGKVLGVDGLPPAAALATIAALLASSDMPTLVVTGRQDTAEEASAALAEYLPPERAPALWPATEALPYEQLPSDQVTAARRVELLDQLTRSGAAPVIVAPARALTQPVSPPEVLRQESRLLKTGDRLDLESFLVTMLAGGYELAPVVEEPGQMARRGGIIDIYPPLRDGSIRIELFGDEIDSLRVFDPETQRSTERLTSIEILPPREISLAERGAALVALRALDTASLRPEVAEEWERNLQRIERGQVPQALDLLAPFFLPDPALLLDYLPERHLVIVLEPSSVQLSLSQLEKQAEELREILEKAGELPLGMRRPYLAWEDLAPRLRTTRQLAFGPLPVGWSPPLAEIAGTEPGFATGAPNYAGQLPDLVPDLKQLQRDHWTVVLATEQSERMTEVLEEQDIYPLRRKQNSTDRNARGDQTQPQTPGTIEVVHSSLAGGWRHEGLKLLLLTDREIFGYRHRARSTTRRRAKPTADLLDKLAPGQFVVHLEHGIARYSGLVKLNTSGSEREYLLLQYAENDRLYLPVDQLDRITLYEGGGLDPKPTRLGTAEWARSKQRVRRAVREMAYELIRLYAARETAEGHAFAPDGTWDHELEEAFPFTETRDQLRAVAAVKADMEQIRPMDRLVCGDVGYGKTEVALRAAFKAVNDGFQVAILVPTTILALQHYHTFRERLAAFPVKVEMLSRLRSRQEQGGILEKLAAGEVDIVIGTHRLLQKDVRFRRLGLAIVDEEQRFGVAHKELLKQLRTNVDVLTMTATPIPRTLHMALSGIRDLSVINTPPRDRLPVRTFVTGSNDILIREAILREIERGGQVYFVHNRVQSIYHMANRLRELVPEARVTVGHGQMAEDELERVMLAFVQHDFDVLVCTTIIESGVDIPNVNTVIIDRAHTHGLTQLYQLRGRVGRGNQRAYAYLLYNQEQSLTPEALARLEAIQEATELGAGLQIALRDLEIRGAGNVLGAEQSGHIAAVGFDLYTRMLALAVEEIRTGQPIEEPESTTIDLPTGAVIPESYIENEELRLEIYRKLAAARSYAGIRDVQEELIDRFGPIPSPVERLIDLARLRIRAGAVGIASIVEREGEVYIRPVTGARLDQRTLRRQLGDGVYVTPNQVRLAIHHLSQDTWPAVLHLVEAVEEATVSVATTAD